MPTPLAFYAPSGELHWEYCYAGWRGKTEWCGYLMVKKFRKYLHSFWHDPRMWQTHTQTDRHRM